MNRIKELRTAKHLTQEELGNILNIQKAAISKYENGRADPSMDILKKMATLFNVSTDYILGISTDSTSNQPPTHPVVDGDPVSEIFDDPDLRGLARRNFEKLTPEQIQKKKQRSLRLMRAMFDEEDD